MMPTPAPPADGSAERQTKFSEPFEMAIDPSKQYTATISTSMGDMVAFLTPGDAPETVNNFVNLARHHYYDGLVFHRVISGFMIQGGCPEGSGRGGPGYRFADELPAPGRYAVGSLAMANAGPDTNGSQFFIVYGDSPLDPNYTVFGSVDEEAVAVVEKVAAKGNTNGLGDGQPVEDVTITSVTVG